MSHASKIRIWYDILSKYELEVIFYQNFNLRWHFIKIRIYSDIPESEAVACSILWVMPPTGMVVNFTEQSSEAVANKLSWKGEKSKSTTGALKRVKKDHW